MLTGSDIAARDETRATTAWALDQILVLLHPFMPFITEELWERTGEGSRKTSLILANWPRLPAIAGAGAEAEMGWVVELISAIRSVRSEMHVPAGAQVPLRVAGANAETRARIDRHRELIVRLARLADIQETAQAERGSLQIVLGEAAFLLPVSEFIDVAAERVRLEKENR